jgi:hypothetical protein
MMQRGTGWRQRPFSGAWFLAVAVFAWCSPALATDYSGGGTFLALGHGARAHGLGGGALAIGRDDAAAYWNPANLPWMTTHSSATLMHAAIFPEVDNGYETASYGRTAGPRLGQPVQRVRPTAWGFGVFVAHLGLGFETGDWSENRVQVAAAYALTNYATLGVGAKLLWLTNDFESGNARGGGFDAGLSLLLTDDLFVAAVVRDAYTEVHFDTERIETPSPGFELGINYHWRTLELELDGTGRESGLQRTSVGAEWHPWRDQVVVRGGWTVIQAGERRNYPSAGLGVRARMFVIDYGAAFDNEDALGIGQRFSLRVEF